MADITSFIPSSDFSIFPSANSAGNGKVTSESNMSEIIAKLKIPNYKLQASDFTLTYDGSDLTITSGIANINGYTFHLDNTVTIALSLSADGDYYVQLKLVYDAHDLLAGDSSGKCTCIKLVYGTTKETNSDVLDLGTISKNGSTYSAITSDDNIYALNLSSMPSPDGQDTLQNYLDSIPNTYVSKIANDTKIGNLDFEYNSNTVVSIDSSTPKIEINNGSGKTTIFAGGIKLSDTNPAIPMAIEAKNLVLRDDSQANRIEINNSKIKAISTQPMELPYVTTFGPIVSPVKNVTVTIDNAGGSPVISTPDSSLQIAVNSGAGTLNVSGNFTATGDIHANRVYNAVFNGFGEIFRKDKDEEIEYGDIVCVGPDGLVHKFDSLVYDIDSVIGVCSDTIGFMLGGENIPKEEQVEVELVGQIWVKTNMTYIKPGSMLAIASDGTVRVTTYRSERFGIALTNVIDGKVRVLYNGH